MKPKLWVADDVWVDEPCVVARDALAPDESGPEFTGLYNADGEPLYRTKEPVGFRVR